MKVIVTCGPSCEPIDEVRRITNFSTGGLGVQLSNTLARAGFEVFCFKGSGATHPGPDERCHLSLFDTNDDLLELLTQTSASHEIAAVFHVAALCDYKVKRVEDDQGRGCQSAKIASRSGALTINLEPATKVIGKMRELFPQEHPGRLEIRTGRHAEQRTRQSHPANSGEPHGCMRVERASLRPWLCVLPATRPAARPRG
jgi:phosphopantothenate---cysteine ligase (CTP)